MNINAVYNDKNAFMNIRTKLDYLYYRFSYIAEKYVFAVFETFFF